MVHRVEKFGNATLYLGDCTEVAKDLSGIHACVTDPPYHLTSIVKRFGAENAAPAKNGKSGVYKRASAGFMGQTWDGGDIAFRPETWAIIWNALLPGAHLAAFSGTRTYHRMACAIEDAGFEIRDMLSWIYGSGFPKSLDVSKQLDKREQNSWHDVTKAIDNIDQTALLAAWIEFLKTASGAGLKFAKSPIETGMSTLKNGFVPAHALLSINRKNSTASAIIAEVSSFDPLRTSREPTSARASAEAITGRWSIAAWFVASALGGREAISSTAAQAPNTTASIAQSNVRALPSAETEARRRVAEALKIWLGRPPSSRRGDTAALCAALTDALKLTTLSLSETFQHLDTRSQTDFASATTVTITESTAASLIASMAATLRSEAIDKAAGAERDVIAPPPYTRGKASQAYSETRKVSHDYPPQPITAPATDAAKQWQGWGTALKPACEPIAFARKPLIGTVVENVLEHGTGALNIDGCRIEYVTVDGGNLALNPHLRKSINGGNGGNIFPTEEDRRIVTPNAIGRWPANVITDGSEEVLAAFPDAESGKSNGGALVGEPSNGSIPPIRRGTLVPRDDSGSAARFFYTAKASKEDRGNDNKHPTVKPTDLMKYLCRLIAPPKGIVLDPFMGSGSTGVAAILEGFHFVGIEQSPEYFDIACRRIEAAVRERESTLFGYADRVVEQKKEVEEPRFVQAEFGV